jgi:peroxiredoxin
LGQLRTIEAELLELGYQVIAISPDRPEKIQAMQAKSDYVYTLLSDSDLTAARAFGLAFKVSSEDVAMLLKYQIDIEDASGKDHHLLPVPAVYIVGKDGKIEFNYVNPVYSVRVQPSVVLAAAKAAR